MLSKDCIVYLCEWRLGLGQVGAHYKCFPLCCSVIGTVLIGHLASLLMLLSYISASFSTYLALSLSLAIMLHLVVWVTSCTQMCDCKLPLLRAVAVPASTWCSCWLCSFPRPLSFIEDSCQHCLWLTVRPLLESEQGQVLQVHSGRQEKGGLQSAPDEWTNSIPLSPIYCSKCAQMLQDAAHVARQLRIYLWAPFFTATSAAAGLRRPLGSLAVLGHCKCTSFQLIFFSINVHARADLNLLMLAPLSQQVNVHKTRSNTIPPSFLAVVLSFSALVCAWMKKKTTISFLLKIEHSFYFKSANFFLYLDFPYYWHSSWTLQRVVPQRSVYQWDLLLIRQRAAITLPYQMTAAVLVLRLSWLSKRLAKGAAALSSRPRIN